MQIEVPLTWTSGDRISDVDLFDMVLLRIAGCVCRVSLLGYRPGVGPRCRLCNTVAVADFPRFKVGSDAGRMVG